MKRVKKTRGKRRTGESGYALVALLAGMTITLVLMTAALPDAQFEAQREAEAEMFWRGQQVAIAIKMFATKNLNPQATIPPGPALPGQFPTKLEDMTEGVTFGVKKFRLLRKSALCDPMTPCDAEKTNWKLVRPGDPLIADLYTAFMKRMQERQGQTGVPVPGLLAFLAQQSGAVKLPGAGVSLGSGVALGGPTAGISPYGPTPLPGAEQQQGQQQGQQGQPQGQPGQAGQQETTGFGGLSEDLRPIVGVVSRSKRKLIRNYFDFETYDQSLFFADSPVIAGGFFTPYYLGEAPVINRGSSDGCPPGTFRIGTGGPCTGGPIPGQIQRQN